MEREMLVESVLLDTDELLARCMGNIEFAERLLTKFQGRLDEDIAELEAAMQAEDLDVVARVAHRIKGASANVAAHDLQKRAGEIEQLARQRCLTDIPAQLEADFRQLRGLARARLPRHDDDLVRADRGRQFGAVLTDRQVRVRDGGQGGHPGGDQRFGGGELPGELARVGILLLQASAQPGGVPDRQAIQSGTQRAQFVAGSVGHPDEDMRARRPANQRSISANGHRSRWLHRST